MGGLFWSGLLVFSLFCSCEGALVSRVLPPVLSLRGGGKFDMNTKPEEVILRDSKTKIKNPPTALETEVAEKLFEGYKTHVDLRMLRYLHVMSVREVKIPESEERALVLVLPFIEMKEYRKIQEPLQKYLEDAFKAHIVLIQHRRVLPKEKHGHRLLKQKRPMSRTLAMVHEAWLEDIIYPHEICAQHRVYSPSTPKPTERIFLDPKARESCENKLEVFTAVFKHLTGKHADFHFLQLREGSEIDKQRCPNKLPCDTAGYRVTEVPPQPLMPPEESGHPRDMDGRPFDVNDHADVMSGHNDVMANSRNDMMAAPHAVDAAA